MSTSKDTQEKAIRDEETGDQIVNAAQMATLAFDGLSLPDDELDALCDAVLIREAERKKKHEAKKVSR